MKKTYRPSGGILGTGLVFIGFGVAMYVTLVTFTTSPDWVTLCALSLFLVLVGAGFMLYAINTKIVVEPEGLLFKNMLGRETNRIPWDEISRVTSAIVDVSGDNGIVHKVTRYYVVTSRLRRVCISSGGDIRGLVQDIEAHAPQIRNDPSSIHADDPTLRDQIIN